MHKALVSLDQWDGTSYLSSAPSVAPGAADGFNAFCCIRGAATDQEVPSLYFGNTADTTQGWGFIRLPDISADPTIGQPALANIGFFLASDAPAEIYVEARIPLSFFVGRTFFLGASFRGAGTNAALYINGARNSPVDVGDALVPGDAGLYYGALNLDGLVGAAYTTQTLANDQDALDALHRAAFQNFIALQTGAVMLTALTKTFADLSLPRPEYIFDSWSQRGPFLTTPPTFPNSGTAGGSLSYGGAPTVLNVFVDGQPHISGDTSIAIVIPP